MASNPAITVRVYPSRGGCKVQYGSKGRYISFQTAGYNRQLLKQPIQPTSSLQAFWLSVLQLVVADITAHP